MYLNFSKNLKYSHSYTSIWGVLIVVISNDTHIQVVTLNTLSVILLIISQ